MKSELASRLKLRYSPVAILFTNEKPERTLEFSEQKWGCVAAMLTASTKGRTVAFSRKTFGCLGGGVGLGLGNFYNGFPGGFTNFLSTGSGEGFPPGEAYKKTPAMAQSFVDNLPITDIPKQYVVFKPLAEVDESKEKPEVIVFYVNPDQLSALVVLANYDRSESSVKIPFAAGCQSICLLPWGEVSKEKPSAIVGMIDISARPVIDADLLSFSMPLSLFEEMESNVSGSFLDKEAWSKVAKRL